MGAAESKRPPIKIKYEKFSRYDRKVREAILIAMYHGRTFAHVHTPLRKFYPVEDILTTLKSLGFKPNWTNKKQTMLLILWDLDMTPEQIEFIIEGAGPRKTN